MGTVPQSGGLEFPGSDRGQWEQLAARALRGKSVEEALFSRTDDGIAIDPLAGRVPALPIDGMRQSAAWTIVQRVDDPDIDRALAQIKSDLAGGATGLAIVFEGAANAFGYGLPCSPDAMNRIFDAVPHGEVHLRLDAHPRGRTTAEALAATLARRKVDLSKMSLSLGIDPAASFAMSGGLRMSIEALYASMPQSLGHFFALGAPGILLEADGRVLHNAGATEAQELGAMIASTAFYLRMFDEARQPLHYSVPHIGFAISTDQDQFVSIAKLRALRKLWARLQEACGLKPFAATIHAETSYRMLTSRDAETNILRSTIATFAAAAGGADTISVLPHTVTHGLPAEFARRVSRNTQVVMAGESHVGFVSDAAAGAGSVEALTEQLCQAAWAEFQAIEQEGGILKSLAAGRIQSRVKAAREDRANEYRTGARTLIGATLFPPAAERDVETLPAERRTVTIDAVATCEPLHPVRIDETIGATA